ncbi:MAG: AAA family ATPase [Pirellulales bacterium]|nr:AAA family ATPase [Pirellulales bacterium]
MPTNDEGQLLDHPKNDKSLMVPRASTLEKSDVERNGAVYPKTAAEPVPETENTAAVYLHALRRHWLLGTVLGIILGGIFAVATFLLVPGYYTPFAFIRVSMSPESIVYAQDHINIHDYEVFKNTQLGLIKSPYVFMAALRKKKIANLSIVKAENDALAWLQDEVRAGYINESEIMRVSLTSKKPKEATELVNAIVDAYIEEVVNKQERERRAMGAQLTQIYNSKENEVRSKRASLINLADKLDAANSESAKVQATVNIQELSSIRAAMLQLQTSLGEATGALEAGKAMLARLEEMPVSEIELEKLVRQDPVCKQHLEMIAGLRQAVAHSGQMVMPGTRNSTTDRMAVQLEGIEQELEIRQNELRELLKGTKRAEIEEQIAAADVQVKIINERIAKLDAQLKAQVQKVSEIGRSSVDIEMMTSELKTLESALAEISVKREKLAIESRARPRIIREQVAQEPVTVDKPKLALILAVMFGGIGFLLPISGIVWWDVQKNRINSTEDVAKGIGLSVIGSVPVIPSRAIRRLGSSSGQDLYWNVRLTESIDSISAKLLRNATIDGKRVILITSAVSGECKTTLATQIAMSLARAGRRTVLVDFDLRSPVIDRSFQLPLVPGVSEVLCGEADVLDSVCETGMNNLFVLTAGQSSHHALQALANGKDQSMFAELQEDYEFVIVDGSPILPVADSRYLSQHVDTVVLSVFRDFSCMPKVVDACEILESFGVTDLEAVVTSSTEVGRGIDRPSEVAESV